jgi:hypothetical protein
VKQKPSALTTPGPVTMPLEATLGKAARIMHDQAPPNM